jgi:hypothetical protein
MLIKKEKEEVLRSLANLSYEDTEKSPSMNQEANLHQIPNLLTPDLGLSRLQNLRKKVILFKSPVYAFVRGA